MQRLFLPFLLLVVLSTFADESILRQLSQVNAEWKNQADGLLLAATADFSKNKTFDDWIATHLMLVEKTLRQRTTKNLTAQQKQNRLQLLDELNGYWHSRTFPRNDYLPYKNPIFIDRKGNYCAVGYLMKQSGAVSLAYDVDSDNKYAYVREIKAKGVKEWADENGFTIDELAWIQPGYPVAFTVADLSRGLNGTVNCMLVDSTSLEIFAGGSFTSSTIGIPCNGVAQYISGFAGWDWIGLGDGLNGTVYALLRINNKLYAGGAFTMAGTVPVSNVAVYDIPTGQWQAMGSLDSTVHSLAVYNNEIYAGGKFTGFVSKWTGSQWQDVAQGFLSGEGVRTLEVWDSLLVIGGNFELATGALRKNVATYNGLQMGTSGFGTVTPVNDFEIFHDSLYAACDVVMGQDTCALSKFDNFNWECLLHPSLTGGYFNGSTIQHLLSYNQRLFCAGTFDCQELFNYGNNLMEFRYDSTGQTSFIPMLIVDSGLQTIAVRGNSICFGGAFLKSLNDTLNHIGILTDVLTSINEQQGPTSRVIDIYPNPSGGIINVEFKDFSVNKYCKVKIMDVMGHVVYQEAICRQIFTIDLSSKNSKGIYLVQVVDGKGNILGSEKVVMQ